MTGKYEGTSDAALIKERNALRDARDDILAEIKEVQGELNRREALQVAEGIVGGMSDTQRDALHQVLGMGSAVNANSTGKGKVEVGN